MKLCGWVAAAGAALLTSVGCGGGAPPAPPSAPPMNAEAAIPGDLDWVLRVDLQRIQRALGPLRLASLGADELSHAAPSVARALAHTDTLWVALRLGHGVEDTDYVVIAEGDFRRFTPGSADEAWGPEVDLGADWRRQDRRGLTPRRRQDLIRLYRRGDDALVFVSAVERDSVARQLERREGDARVTPPALGLLSLAGRLDRGLPALSQRAPLLSALVADARQLTCHAGFEGGELDVELDVEYVDEATAEVAEKGAQAALTQAIAFTSLRPWFARARLSRVGAHLVLRLTVPRDALLALLRASEAPDAISPAP